MWYTTKWFWLNMIAVIVAVIQYFINNDMFTAWLPWEGLALVILNMIAGMIQSGQVARLKGEVNTLKKAKK